ncbi:MAG: GyrI-like domain-containing protein [Phycisphaerae bacterium]|nr:GyrI-like domain-containing protein [Phycisphaerae bacterium]
MEVKVETRNPVKVAFVRHLGPYAEAHPAWETLCKFAVKCPQIDMNKPGIGLSYDDPDTTPPAEIRYDACFELAGDFEATGDIGVTEIPGGQYAVAIHEGPYEKMIDTYCALFNDWMPANGRELRPDTPCVEIYLNCPRETPPDQLKTQICVPLV